MGSQSSKQRKNSTDNDYGNRKSNDQKRNSHSSSPGSPSASRRSSVNGLTINRTISRPIKGVDPEPTFAQPSISRHKHNKS